MPAKVLVTGGAGYIGSHTLLEVLVAGHEVHVLDSFVNASPEALTRVAALAGRGFETTEGDVRDRAALDRIVAGFRPEAIIQILGEPIEQESGVSCLPRASEAAAGEVSIETIAAHLDTHDLPPLDLLIRTSGEIRLSNFLLWQAAYAEMLFVDTLWPDFDGATLAQALDIFAGRQRRFGGL